MLIDGSMPVSRACSFHEVQCPVTEKDVSRMFSRAIEEARKIYNTITYVMARPKRIATRPIDAVE